MKREHVALTGAPNPAGVMRLELWFTPSGEPQYLHAPDQCGRFARVIRAQAGTGSLAVPAALKLEHPPTLETATRRPGIAKFAGEVQAQKQLLKHRHQDRSSRVVRMFQFWPVPENMNSDELPPSIVCPNAIHAIEPRCPECYRPLRDTLRCDHGRHQVRAPLEILDASVRRSNACSECPLKKSQTLCPAVWLNQEPRRLILQEQLDLSLEEYLPALRRMHDVSNAELQPGTATQQLTQRELRLQNHLKERLSRRQLKGAINQAEVSHVDHLRHALNLFADLITGVQELWDAGLTHLDLKPDNVCLTLDQDRAILRIIDLGHAESESAAWNFRWNSLQEDHDRNLLPSDFAPAELWSGRATVLETRMEQAGDFVRLTCPSNRAATEFPVCTHDWFYLSQPGRPTRFCRVIHVRDETGRLVITACGCEPGQQPVVNTIPAETEWATASHDATVRIFACAGRAADLFASGLILISLLTCQTTNVRPLRDSIASFGRHLRAVHRDLADLPARSAVRWLIQHSGAHARVLEPILASARHLSPEIRILTEDVVALALRMTIRGVPDFSLALNHSDPCSEVLPSIQSELSRLRHRLLIHSQRLQTTQQLRDVRLAGCERLEQWINSCTTSCSPPPDMKRPRYRRELLRRIVDSVSDDPIANAREFRMALLQYRGQLPWLKEDLQLFQSEVLSNMTDSQQVHPLLMTLMELLSGDCEQFQDTAIEGSSAGETNGTSESISFLTTKLQSHALAIRRAVRNTLRAMQPVLSRGRGRMNSNTIAGMQCALVRVRECISSSMECLEQFRMAMDRRSQSQQRVLQIWNRLGHHRTAGWSVLGQLVQSHFDQRTRQDQRILQSMSDAMQQVHAACDQLQRDIIDELHRQRTAWHWGVRGWIRRWFSHLLRRSDSVPYVLPGDVTKTSGASLRKSVSSLPRISGRSPGSAANVKIPALPQ